MASRKLQLTNDEITREFQNASSERCPEILSPDQLANLFGLSVKTIYEWLSKGRLDGAYRKRGKHCLIWRNRAIAIIMNGKEWT